MGTAEHSASALAENSLNLTPSPTLEPVYEQDQNLDTSTTGSWPLESSDNLEKEHVKNDEDNTASASVSPVVVVVPQLTSHHGLKENNYEMPIINYYDDQLQYNADTANSTQVNLAQNSQSITTSSSTLEPVFEPEEHLSTVTEFGWPSELNYSEDKLAKKEEDELEDLTPLESSHVVVVVAPLSSSIGTNQTEIKHASSTTALKGPQLSDNATLVNSTKEHSTSTVVQNELKSTTTSTLTPVYQHGQHLSTSTVATVSLEPSNDSKQKVKKEDNSSSSTSPAAVSPISSSIQMKRKENTHPMPAVGYFAPQFQYNGDFAAELNRLYYSSQLTFDGHSGSGNKKQVKTDVGEELFTGRHF